MDNQIIKIENKRIGRVRIYILNEGHEMPYCEKFEGNQESILKRCQVVLEGLENLLPFGTWMLKVESLDLTEAIFIEKGNILDSNFESLI